MVIASTNAKKTIDKRCISCFKKSYQGLFEKFNSPFSERLSFLIFYQHVILKHKTLSAPQMQSILNRRFCEIFGFKDPFENEKIESNNIAKELCEIWKPRVKKSKNQFDLALRLAIAGNIMDYGANNTFNIYKTIEDVISANFAIDDANLMKEKIKEANTILYLGDNAGEIVFDKLFIETCLTGKNVLYAVRGKPVLNDVTMADAESVGLFEVAQVISNGNDAPSTILSKCSYEFKKAYNNADLIISKGQGNLEGLLAENNPRIFFLLMVKCHVIAELINVEKGSFVILNQSKK